MKKLLFLLLAAATVTACDNDDENFNPDSGSYTCTLKVTDTAGDVTNQTSGVICNLTEQPDKSVALTTDRRFSKAQAQSSPKSTMPLTKTT